MAKVDWNTTTVTVESKLNLFELINLIETLSEEAQEQVVIELLCAFSEPQQDRVRSWLDE